MAKALIVHDPYRNINTTLTEFAKAEGAPRSAVSHYFWSHRSLEKFRNRPAKGTGNGIRPHTYQCDGVFITYKKAEEITGLGYDILRKMKDKYGISDVRDIQKQYLLSREKIRARRLYETSDGRKMTPKEFARTFGATYNAVMCWLNRKGSFEGFENRRNSRSNPKKYLHSGLGEYRTMKEWEKYFSSSKDSIKIWLRNHGHDLKGFENRNRKNRRHC